MKLSREDRKDLARVLIAENPLTKSRERIAIKGLLELDDRLLGISNRNKNFCDYGDCMAYKLIPYDYYRPRPHEDWYCWKHRCINILNSLIKGE